MSKHMSSATPWDARATASTHVRQVWETRGLNHSVASPNLSIDQGEL